MKFAKHTLLIATLAIATTSAQASLWDSVTSLFGGSTAEDQTTVAAPAEASANSTANMISTGLKLIPILTQTLGVTDGQAQGGMGALLQAAQVLMAGSDYSTLANAIPNASALLSAVPTQQTESSGGLMDAAMKMASEQSDTVKVGADLVSQFKTLGMGAEMIPKFTEAAEGYLTESGSSDASGLLTSALSFL